MDEDGGRQGVSVSQSADWAPALIAAGIVGVFVVEQLVPQLELGFPASFGLFVVDGARTSRGYDGPHWTSSEGDPSSRHSVVDHSPVNVAE